jgi:VWFA-related protein
MKCNLSRKLFLALFILLSLSVAPVWSQSKRQQPTTTQTEEKKNKRPDLSGNTNKDQKEQEKPKETIYEDSDIVKIDTTIINVDAVVYNKKSGQIVTGLKKENFAVFEDGVLQEITNFSTPEAPITVSLVVEFSKWSEVFGYLGSRGFDPGKYETIRPVAYFLSKFIQPPNDYASVIAFDIRPTPLTDFTNDPNRLNQVVNLLLRNNPAFRENNLFDALKFTLIGGKGDAVVLENTKERTQEYAGLAGLKQRRKAIILVASGIDTFSKINYDQARKIIQEAGVPIYILGTGEMFFKLYEDRLGATDGIDGSPGRLTILQARNTLSTIAKESGGAYYPITFESELPNALNSINALMRNQYSIAYDGSNKKDGKKHKLEVKVDLNKDGQYEKDLVVQHRPFYTSPKPDDKK